MASQSPDRRLLREQLDRLAATAGRFLARWHLRRDLRIACRGALVWLIVVPAALLAAQLVLWLANRPALRLPFSIGFAIAWLVLLALFAPVAAIIGQLVWRRLRRPIDRRGSLALFDAQLDTQERLVTADEFLAAGERADEEQTSLFMRAAVDDAAPHVEAALVTQLEPRPLPAWQVTRISWLSVPAAVALLLLAAWIGRLPGRAAAPADTDAMAARADATGPLTRDGRDPHEAPPPRRTARKEEEPDAALTVRESPPSQDAAPKLSRNDEQTEGQSKSGTQAPTQASSHSSNASGRSADQKTPAQQSKTQPERAEDQPKERPEDEKKQESKKAPSQQAMDATSGEGKSKSSSSDANNLPSEEQPDRAGAQKEAGGPDQGVQDEDEEEKTNGAEQPTLRKKKPPVDRNALPIPTGDQGVPPNARTGPGGRKKTRGVPAMILGVPVPDRIQGMKNPGRSKVTQENANPKEEPQTALEAEQRTARQDAVGPIQHPLLLPWMQDVIKTYFMSVHAASPPSQPSQQR